MVLVDQRIRILYAKDIKRCGNEKQAAACFKMTNRNVKEVAHECRLTNSERQAVAWRKVLGKRCKS